MIHIEDIPQNRFMADLWLKRAIEEDYRNLQHVPIKYLTKHFCLEVIKINPRAIKHVPLEKRTYAVKDRALRKWSSAYKHIEKEFVFKWFAENEWSLKYTNLDDQYQMELIEWKPTLFAYLKKPSIACQEKILNTYPYLIIQGSNIEPHILEAASKKDPSALVNTWNVIREPLVAPITWNKKIRDRAFNFVKEHPAAFFGFTGELVVPERLHNQLIATNPLFILSISNRNEALCLRAIEKCPYVFSLLPEKNQTLAVCKRACELDPNCAHYITNHIMRTLMLS